MSSLAQRLLVALALGPFLLVAAYFGGLYFFLPIGLLLVIAATEYSAITRSLGRQTPNWLLVPAVAALLVAAQWGTLGLMTLALFVSTLVIVIYALWLHERAATTDAALDWFALLAGVMLVGWVGGHFLLLRNLPVNGWQWTALTFMSIWTADGAAFITGKFLVGRVLGRHAISPRISPNKTVEGYVGGIIASVLVSLAVAWLLVLPMGLAFVVALFVSTLGLVGDLSISLLKREAGVKDTGKLFPGHGGVLDRLDSVIWSVAIAYYLVTYLSPFFD